MDDIDRLVKYYPDFIPNGGEIYHHLRTEVIDLVDPARSTVGKESRTGKQRYSCIVSGSGQDHSDAKSDYFSYDGLMNYTWDQAPWVDGIMQYLTGALDRDPRFDSLKSDLYTQLNGEARGSSSYEDFILGKANPIEIKPFDYCLVHYYQDGTANIAWHSDKEALTRVVASISMGSTRKFRFREKKETKGHLREFDLYNGDLVLMLPGCQQRYKHSVPSQAEVKADRINLTFRYIDRP